MIKEFALDPRTIASWQDARYLLEKFGFSNGRLICRLPKEKESKKLWEQMVLESIVKPTDRSRVFSKLKSIKRTHFIERNSSYDDSKDWLYNAQCEHLKAEFQAIISTENPSKDDYIIVYDDEFDEEHIKFRTDTSKSINRVAIDMALSISGLLKLSKKIIFVDPKFCNLEPRHTRPFIEFMNAIYSRNNVLPILNIEYHMEERRDAQFDKDIQTKICSNFPQSYKFDLIMWPQKVLHNRYVLTNLGGVEFGIGLDEDTTRLKPTDVITNLGNEAYKKEYDFYNNNKPLSRKAYIGVK